MAKCHSCSGVTELPRIAPAQTPVTTKAAQAFDFIPIPVRTRSQSPSKRKTDDVGEFSRAKRSKSDAVYQSSGTVINTAEQVPTPTHIPGIEKLNVTRTSHDSPGSNVCADGYKGQADHEEEIRFLNATSETLRYLRKASEQESSGGDELSRCTHEVAQCMGECIAGSPSKDRAVDQPEISQSPVLTPWSKEVARELVRRLKSSYGYAEVLNPNLEIEQSINLWYLQKLREDAQNVPYDATPAMFFILPTLREERENAHYAFITHPYITHKTASSAKGMERELKQHVVSFFDKCLTYQVAAVYDVQVRLNGPLLRIGGDDLFKSIDGLDTGGEDWPELEKHNHRVWQELVLRDTQLPTRDNGKYTRAKRDRAHSSMGSLGLTGLFFNDKKDDEYEGDDEATEEPIFFPGNTHHRRDSHINIGDLLYSGSEVEIEEEPHKSPPVDVERVLDTRSLSSSSDRRTNSNSNEQLIVGAKRFYGEEDYIDLVSEITDETDVSRQSLTASRCSRGRGSLQERHDH
ncbi:hypothetical protein WAI453_005910 [Rhynchosporium graminicola]